MNKRLRSSSLTYKVDYITQNTISEMKKVFWFSRHNMTEEQAAMFAGLQITKVNGSPANVHVPFQGSVNDGEEETLPPVKDMVKDFDILAIVAPIGLQQQFLAVAGGRPVIFAKTKRELVKVEGQEDKVTFIFDGWEQLEKIEVVTKPFSL